MNKIQRLRKEKDFNVTDRIILEVERNEEIISAINHFKDYICTEILAEQITVKEKLDNGEDVDINETPVRISITVI